ncbi:MAG: hypothetical protein QOI61_1780, partial [Actinomycetota bacterium]
MRDATRTRRWMTFGAVLVGAWATLSGLAQAATPLTATPNSGPIGQSVHLAGDVDCPDVETGGNILVSLERFDDDGNWFSGSLGEFPKGADGTIDATTTIPATMGKMDVDHQITTVPVEPGAYDIVMTCSYDTGNPDGGSVPFTVTESQAGTTTTTTTPGTTTTTVSSGTTTTAAPGASTTTTTTVFAPPASPPANAPAFDGLSSGTAPAGGTLTVDQGGFLPGEVVQVVLYSAPVVVKSNVVASAAGKVTTSFTVPANTAPGAHTVVLFGTQTVKQAPLTVTSASLARAGAKDALPL